MDFSEFSTLLPRRALWVFGYGSLMWAPGFRPLARRPVLVHGYHRSLCVLSTLHRGSPERPGLVLGLRRGGSCWGMALRIDPARAVPVLRKLWDREMAYAVYQPHVLTARGKGGTAVAAVTFVADPLHTQYAGELDIGSMARAVAHSRGGRGANIDYLGQTLAHMRRLGVHDPHLEQVLREARRLASGTAHGANPAGALGIPKV
jgi:cation transport protein ChaC